MSFLPPSTINTGGPWAGLHYQHSSNGHYDLIVNGSVSSGQSIEFTDSSGTLTLNVNPATNGSSTPAYFAIGTGSLVTSGTVSSGNSITFYSASNSVKGTITVPDFYTGGGGTSTESSTSSAVASLGLQSGVLNMFIPASSTGGSYSVFEGSVLKQVTTHVATVADMVPITSWSMGNYSIWRVYFNGNIINTWPAAIPSNSTTKKVHCNFW